MSTLNEQHVALLNSLVERTLDSAEGDLDAAKAVKTPSFKALFARRSMERKQLAAELQAEVRSLGGAPEDEATILASAHRLYLTLKTMVTGTDQTILDALLIAETGIKTAFERALGEKFLPIPVKVVLINAHALIKAQRSELGDLRHGRAEGYRPAATVHF